MNTSFTANYGAVAILILLVVMGFFGCDRGDFSVKNGQIRGHGMSFDLPPDFVDMQEHPDFKGTNQARQMSRAGAAAAVGELGDQVYTLININPLGPVDAIDVDEEGCRDLAQNVTEQFQGKTRQLGLSGPTDFEDLKTPGHINGTDCEFMVSMGGGSFHVHAVLFTHNDKVFIASCETDVRDEAVDLCDELFSTWRR